jgi:putative flippase GtrA
VKRDVAAGVRFLVAGGANTVVTGVALSLLSFVIDARLAYAIVFVLGIALSLFLSGRYVFRRRITWKRTVAYVVVYLVVFLIGLGVLHLALRAGLPPPWSGTVALVTAPLSFLGGRVVFWTFGPDAGEQERDGLLRAPAGDLRVDDDR